MPYKHRLVFTCCVLGIAVGLSFNYKFSLGSQDEQEIMLKLQSAISLILLPVRELHLRNKLKMPTCRHLEGIIAINAKFTKKMSDAKELRKKSSNSCYGISELKLEDFLKH